MVGTLDHGVKRIHRISGRVPIGSCVGSRAGVEWRGYPLSPRPGGATRRPQRHEAGEGPPRCSYRPPVGAGRRRPVHRVARRAPGGQGEGEAKASDLTVRAEGEVQAGCRAPGASSGGVPRAGRGARGFGPANGAGRGFCRDVGVSIKSRGAIRPRAAGSVWGTGGKDATGQQSEHLGSFKVSTDVAGDPAHPTSKNGVTSSHLAVSIGVELVGRASLEWAWGWGAVSGSPRRRSAPSAWARTGSWGEEIPRSMSRPGSRVAATSGIVG